MIISPATPSPRGAFGVLALLEPSVFVPVNLGAIGCGKGLSVLAAGGAGSDEMMYPGTPPALGICSGAVLLELCGCPALGFSSFGSGSDSLISGTGGWPSKTFGILGAS